MASITTQRGGNRCIQFVDENTTRKTIRPGKCDRKAAESICRHVEVLLGAKLTGQPIPRETAVWLAGVGVKLRDRLAAVGLVEAPKRMLLGAFLKRHILSHPEVKPATLEVMQPADDVRQVGEAGGSGTVAAIVPQPAVES